MLGKIGLGLLVAGIAASGYICRMGSSMSRWTSPPKPEPTCTSSFQRNLRRSVLISFPRVSPGTRSAKNFTILLPTLELTATELAKLSRLGPSWKCATQRNMCW